MEREIQQRISKAVSDVTAEHDARLQVVEKAARDRENALAIAHAQELQDAQDREKQVRDELSKAQVLLAMFQRYLAIVAAALVVAVTVIIVLLFKILASPIVLSVAVFMLVLGVGLLLYFCPDLVLAILQFFMWIWNNPTRGIIVLVILFLLHRFRSKIFKRLVGETHMGKLQAQHQEGLNKIAKLEQELKALQTEHQNLKKLNAEMQQMQFKASQMLKSPSPPRSEMTPFLPAQIQESSAAAAEQKMFSDSPPLCHGQTLPAHTPIRNISSP
jgi:ABC-type multidrug transport system fused ATPase/permease subunit